MNNIQKLLLDAKRKIIFLLIVKNITIIFISIFFVVFINYFADILVVSTHLFRLIIWLIAVGFSIYLLVEIILKINYLKHSDEQIAILLQKKNPTLKDNLINAIQLKLTKKIETSQELAEKFIEQTSQKISPNLSKTVINFGSIKGIFIIFFVVFINFVLFYKSFRLNRYLMPFKNDIKVSVIPGNIAITSGSTVNVYATVKFEKSTPNLVFREIDGNWRKNKMKKIAPDKYSETIEKITDDIDYYIEVLDDRSQRYRIKIVAPLTIADIKLEYFYPPNTGLQNKIVNETDIEALAGTTVKISARANKKIKEAFLFSSAMRSVAYYEDKVTRAETLLPCNSAQDGSSADIVEKNKMELIQVDTFEKENILTSTIVIGKQSCFWFEVKSIDDEDYQSVKYKIKVIKNNPPIVEIVSPAFDVAISENGILKIVYSAEDDFGIKKIEIDYLTLKKKNLIKSFSKPQQKIIDDYEIAISDLALKSGDTIQYQLIVTDNNIYPFPLVGNSKIYTIEVLSLEMEHKIIENALVDFNNELQEILSKQLQSNTMFTKHDFENALKMQKDVQESTSAETDNFQKVLEKMKDDSLTTYQTYNEYKNLSQALSNLEKQKMQDAINMLSDKQYDQAGQKQDEIADEIKRLSEISENILKSQKMEDLVSTVAEMSGISTGIEKNLNNMKAMPNVEKMKELKKTMEKLSELTNKLAEKISKMPKELPNDFTNNKNVKKIDLAKMRFTADEMKWTLEAGNIDKAIELAKKLNQQISDMLSSVENASQSVSHKDNAELELKLNKLSSELNEIVETQKNIITDTQKIDVRRLEKILVLQKELIKKLVELQKQSISKLQNSKMMLKKNNEVAANIHNLYNSPEIKMNTILQEFITEKINKSRQLLTATISELDTVYRNIHFKEPAEYLLESKLLEEKILSELTDFSPNKTTIFSNEDFERHKKLSETQRLNQQKIGGIKQNLLELANKTTLVSLETIEGILSSEKSMEGASGELLISNILSAIDFEKKALDDLLNSKDALDKTSSQMKSIMGESMAGRTMQRIRMRGNDSGGSTGFRGRFVKIPSKDDYRPPKEFREEIIKSLRQKYPQKYEMLIKDYFKRLVE
ncbi:MAG: hypothetical protein ABID79_00690 [Elusimicrobiota bacterium]